MADIPQEDILRAQRNAAVDTAIDQSVQRVDAEADRVTAERIAAQTAVQRDIAAAQRDRVAGERNMAQTALAIEQQEAAGSRTGFYTLLGIVVLVLLIVAGVYLTRGNTPNTSVTINRTAPVASPPPTIVYTPTTTAPISSLPIEATPAQPASPAAPATAAAPVAPAPPVAQASPSDNSDTTTTTTTTTVPNNANTGTAGGNAAGGSDQTTNP
jgi:hypothetical protein